MTASRFASGTSHTRYDAESSDFRPTISNNRPIFYTESPDPRSMESSSLRQVRGRQSSSRAHGKRITKIQARGLRDRRSLGEGGSSPRQSQMAGWGTRPPVIDLSAVSCFAVLAEVEILEKIGV